MSEIAIFNRQGSRPVHVILLRRIVGHLLEKILARTDYDLTVHLVNAPEMAAVNTSHLRHTGSTDVITLDYCEVSPNPSGEIFVCMDEAVIQARRFRTLWQKEISRYIVHGVLHLSGHDDRHASPRRRMKREENRLLGELQRRFDLRKLHRAAKLKR